MFYKKSLSMLRCFDSECRIGDTLQNVKNVSFSWHHLRRLASRVGTLAPGEGILTIVMRHTRSSPITRPRNRFTFNLRSSSQHIAPLVCQTNDLTGFSLPVVCSPDKGSDPRPGARRIDHVKLDTRAGAKKRGQEKLAPSVD